MKGEVNDLSLQMKKFINKLSCSPLSIRNSCDKIVEVRGAIFLGNFIIVVIVVKCVVVYDVSDAVDGIRRIK